MFNKILKFFKINSTKKIKSNKNIKSTKKIKSTKISLKDLQKLAIKYNIPYKGSSKQKIATLLASIRGSYMTKKEKLLILPLLNPGLVNTKIFKKYINTPPKKFK